MSKFFIDQNSKYIGGFDGATPPANAIEIPSAPEHAENIWDGTSWVKSPAQIIQELEAAVDKHIDSVAKADKWDSRITCTIRAGYPNPWQNKAIAFGQWMDACYAHCIQVQNDVAAGTRPIPTEAELIAELPVMVWPV
jgi:hypothetical protein